MPSPVEQQALSLILPKIVTPYHADAFEHELSSLDLLDEFPFLADRIRHGFPITKGSFDFPVTRTPANHFSCIGYDEFLDSFLSDEIRLGRISGPFSLAEMEIIFGGTFVTTPFILAIDKRGLGQPDKVRVCRHSSKVYEDGFSVNDFINSDDFSTVWTTAADAAEIVCPSFDVRISLPLFTSLSSSQPGFPSALSHPSVVC